MSGGKERPILFSGPMVRAILDGTKTQTRRVVKPIKGVTPERIAEAEQEIVGRLCPYGQPGDRLWVRETHWINGGSERDEHGRALVAYRADGEMPSNMVGTRWRPSIYMPRWASRITLEVTDVRVERVQDITDDDARAEGVIAPQRYVGAATDAFRKLWDDINAARGYGWDENPWVWVVSFKRATP